MSFIQSIKSFYKNYFNFRGRASRSEYWWNNLLSYGLIAIWYAVYFVALFSLIDAGSDPTEATLIAYGQTGIVGILLLIFLLASFIPSLSISFRRIHDKNKSAWNFLWFLVPIFGFIPILIWFCQRGTVGENRFGADPLAQKANILDT